MTGRRQQAPAEAHGPKFDESAVVMIALSRYSLGLPHNRIEQMQIRISSVLLRKEGRRFF